MRGDPRARKRGRKAQSRSSRDRGSSSLAWTDRGIHVTHRQPGPQAGRKRSRGVAASRGSSGLAWTDRGTCAPLPFHVTGGQPAVGQGVVVHAREDFA
ncbi:unnamed protein product [Spirodela intermedia]|uniref:Uncharacterized protein n=1 Tax=Spirodela intermedia TaxID=51605 RepID=A0ABN7EBB1_SPIIN|nr:unnamed protein product [Spirodela intermedia]